MFAQAKRVTNTFRGLCANQAHSTAKRQIARQNVDHVFNQRTASSLSNKLSCFVHSRSQRSLSFLKPQCVTRLPIRSAPAVCCYSSSTKASTSTVSRDEISHFDALASTWWDPNGSSALLHKMNPARLSFLKSHVTTPELFMSDVDGASPFWLSDKKVLDIGCGGGLLAEALTRVGGEVTGVDASSAGIAVAKAHAKRMDLQIEYLNTSAEELVHSQSDMYDVVCAMEILEHVASPPAFLRTVMALMKPDGLLIISTIEKSRFAKLLTCTIAEDILRLVPKGTHNYDKFVPKAAIKKWMGELGGEVIDTRGIIFNPLNGSWQVLAQGQSWGEACNYIMAIRKSA